MKPANKDKWFSTARYRVFVESNNKGESEDQAEARSQTVSNILPKSILSKTRLWEVPDRCKLQRHDPISIS